jgi:hypothetical protein
MVAASILKTLADPKGVPFVLRGLNSQYIDSNSITLVYLTEILFRAQALMDELCSARNRGLMNILSNLYGTWHILTISVL